MKVPSWIFSWRRSRSKGFPPMLPEFGVRVVLRKGDKVVRRGADGRVVILRVTVDGGATSEILSSTDEHGVA